MKELWKKLAKIKAENEEEIEKNVKAKLNRWEERKLQENKRHKYYCV